MNGTPRVGHQSNADEARRYLLEKGQPLADDAFLVLQQCSEIAAWPRQIANEARADWVGGGGKNDRGYGRFTLQSVGNLRGMGGAPLGPQRQRLFRQRWSLVAGRGRQVLTRES